MTDASNSRALQVLNFLAEHPTQSFTLSELAERLSLSYGSAHRVLNTLTEAGYLCRHATHKTYSLGLVLVTLGQAAERRHQLLSIARREMARLSTELGLQCLASTIAGGDMVFVAKEGVSATAAGVISVGQRRPYMPPMGLGHLAWADKAQTERYFERAPALTAGQKNFLLQARDVVRKRGYTLSGMGDTLLAISKVMIECGNDYRVPQVWDRIERLMGALSEDEIQWLTLDRLDDQRLGHLSAPVFGTDGQAVLEISLTGFPGQLGRADVEVYIERLLATTTLITSEGRGPG